VVVGPVTIILRRRNSSDSKPILQPDLLTQSRAGRKDIIGTVTAIVLGGLFQSTPESNYGYRSAVEFPCLDLGFFAVIGCRLRSFRNRRRVECLVARSAWVLTESGACVRRGHFSLCRARNACDSYYHCFAITALGQFFHRHLDRDTIQFISVIRRRHKDVAHWIGI